MTSLVAFFATLGSLISSVPWLSIALGAFGVYMTVSLLRYHRREDNRYDLWDTLMSKGKADLTKHVIVAFAALTIWTIVVMVQKNMNVETLLLGALGIFVAQRIVNGVADTMKGVPQDEPMQDRIAEDDKVEASKDADAVTPEEKKDGGCG